MLQYETTANKLSKMSDKTTKKAKKLSEKNSVAKKYLTAHADDDWSYHSGNSNLNLPE